MTLIDFMHAHADGLGILAIFTLIGLVIMVGEIALAWGARR